MFVSSIKWVFLVTLLVSPVAGYSQSSSAAMRPQESVDPADSSKGLSPDAIRKIPAQGPYHPITAKQRLEWFFVETGRPESLLAGAFTAGIGTARDKPPEYGPHLEGGAERYGIRFSGVATSNAIEASFGAIWGEDPRYVRLGQRSVPRRITNVLLLTVTARDRSGHLKPAYARYIAMSGNNFISNTWRADSEADTNSALIRTGYGLLARLASNTFAEFWPSIAPHVLPHHEPAYH
jgi:hypothetical protein